MFPLFFSFFLLLVHPSAQTSFRPKALVLPVSKDPSTYQYITQINQRTPFVPVKLSLDLGGQDLWVDCDNGYISSSYKPAHCNSAPCSLAKSLGCGTCFAGPKPGCNNSTCSLFPYNPFITTSTIGELAQDVVSVKSTNGKNPGKSVSVPKLLFTCGSNPVLPGLARGVKGIAGLGRTRISLPSLFSAAFSFHRKFAICLTSSSNSNGVVFFGDGPYFMQPDKEISQNLIYTPLIQNPESSADYYIGVKAIKVNQKVVAVNKTLLSINKHGRGGTKISTVTPYSVMESSIYKAFVSTFLKEMLHIPRVPAVKPFQFCFNATGISSTRVGPPVPTIDLVLQSNNVFWRIFGANSVVYVREDVICLAFVDGGSEMAASIEIGGYQLEDNLLQFDLATSRLGFSSTLLFRQTTCANFNFTSSA